MEETSEDENYYENFRALSETWDCETSDTDEEDTVSIPNEEGNEQSKRKREEDFGNIDESPTKKVSLQEQINKESESLTTEEVPTGLKMEEKVLQEVKNDKESLLQKRVRFC